MPGAAGRSGAAIGAAPLAPVLYCLFSLFKAWRRSPSEASREAWSNLRMATHAYVRYQDDQRKAIVPVRDIKGFRNSDDFASKVYLVKWTDDSGTSDFYRARVLLVGGKSSGAKFWRIFIG